MKRELKEKLIQIGDNILISSRNALFLSMRFLDIIFSTLNYKLSVSTRTIGTDGILIFYHPKFLIDLYQTSPILVNRVYLHIVLHCIFRHLVNQEKREEEYWNLACDIAIESIIDSMDNKTINWTISGFREQIYKELSYSLNILNAESIYWYLLNNKKGFREIEIWQKEFLVDDHIFWNENKKEQQQEKNKELDKKWNNISKKVQTNLETFSRNIGELAGTLMQQLKIENREQYNYRDFLRKFSILKEEIQIDIDSFDPIFYLYGLEHYGNMPLIEPLEYKEVEKVEEFVIAIDTSGSCSGKLVKSFLEETYTILKDTETFTKKVCIHILQCDAKIQEDFLVTCREDLDKYMKEFSIKGFGGTDFRSVFSYVDSLIQKKSLSHLKGVLYFTDGYGIYPTKKPSYDVAFVFLNKSNLDIHVPSWAIKLIIESKHIGNEKER